MADEAETSTDTPDIRATAVRSRDPDPITYLERGNEPTREEIRELTERWA